MMLGLVNRALQGFVTETYGCAAWQETAARAKSPTPSFEPMLLYDDALTQELVSAASEVLQKPRHALLEDLGTWLISDPRRHMLRRLLRFGGAGYEEFLHSLDDLADLLRLALDDLVLPAIRYCPAPPGAAGAGDLLRVQAGLPGYCAVLLGALRAMADEYGVLVILQGQEDAGGAGTIRVELLDPCFASARDFRLSVQRA